MSPLLGSLFLIAMLSAIMSTVNSILLVTGGAFAHDLYKRLVNPRASQRRLVWVNRLSIVVLGLRAVLVRDAASSATSRPSSIEQAKFIASFFFVPVVLGLNWRRGTKEGAIWSMVAGFVGCLIWTFTLQRSFATHGIDSVEVGVVLSALTFILVSRLTPPTPAENLAIFFDEARGARSRLSGQSDTRGQVAGAASVSTSFNVYNDEALEATRARGHPPRRATRAARAVRDARPRIGHGRRGSRRPLHRRPADRRSACR